MFSNAGKYGLRAVLYLAVYATKDQKIGVDHIAEALEVPRHFLAKILQQLAKAGIVTSVKGPHGGFYCSEENLSVKMQAVIECIEGKNVVAECVLGLKSCSAKRPCPLHFQAQTYRQGLFYQMNQHSIQEMALRVQREKLVI